MKVSPTPMKSVVSRCDIDNTNSNIDIGAHWLPKAVALTIMDPNQPESLMKLPFSI